jgi:hypothetical protein
LETGAFLILNKISNHKNLLTPTPLSKIALIRVRLNAACGIYDWPEQKAKYGIKKKCLFIKNTENRQRRDKSKINPTITLAEYND